MDKTYIHLGSNNSVKEIAANSVRKEDIELVSDQKLGLLSVRAIVFLLLWYVFSGCTLFLNKYILKYLNGNPWVLGKSLSINVVG